MELPNVTETLFKEMGAKKKVVKKTVSNLKSEDKPIVSRDAKALEFQLNNHLRLRYKQQTRVTLHTPVNNTVEDISSFLSGQEKPKKTWNALPIYEKWKLVQAHTDDPALLRQYKALLRQGKLSAVYDIEKNEIRDIQEVSTNKK